MQRCFKCKAVTIKIRIISFKILAKESKMLKIIRRKRDLKNMETDLTAKLPLKEHIRNMKKILELVGTMDKTYFLFAGIVHMINTGVPYLELLLSAYILDGLKNQKLKEMIIVTGTTIVGIFILNSIASMIWNRLEIRRERVFYLYSSMTEVKMLSMDFSRIDSSEIKELREKMNRDMNWGAGLNSVFWQFNGILFEICNIIGAIVLGMPVVILIMKSKGYEIFVLLLVIFIAIFGIQCQKYFYKKAQAFMFRSYTEEEKEDMFCFSWMFAQGDGYHYKNGKDVRIYNGYDLIKRWTVDVLYKKPFRKELRNGAIGEAGAGFFCGIVNQAMEGSAYLIIAMAALTGTISIGNMIKFAGCLRNLMVSLVSLFSNIGDFALTARKHISTLEFLELENKMYAGKLPVEKRSDNEYQIEFRNVSFRYSGTMEYVLKNFSMKLKIGEKLAVVGMNGSGKTTMIKLLCRLYDPDEGEILLNNVDIKKFKQEEYSKLFSIVFQDYKLFPYKLAENVAVSMNYNTEKVMKCLENAGFGKRLKELEQGIDSYLYKDYDDNGLEISGGEAQKIAIARAIYKDSPFILLDEPTAALDPLAEYEIYTSFDKIIGTKTAIYISHRLSSCQFCEKIAVFHEGKLVQFGNHKELIQNKNGKYYEMWQAQAQYYQNS